MNAEILISPSGNSLETFWTEAGTAKVPLVISMGNWEPAFRAFFSSSWTTLPSTV